jgi:hypothetical protein
VTTSFATSLAGAKYKTWSIIANVAKLGTFTSFKPGDGTSFLLESGLNAWVPTSGTLTIKATSGKANVTLGDHEGATTGKVSNKGSWSCPPGT